MRSPNAPYSGPSQEQLVQSKLTIAHTAANPHNNPRTWRRSTRNSTKAEMAKAARIQLNSRAAVPPKGEEIAEIP